MLKLGFLIIFLISISRAYSNQRISQLKCEEYKNLIATFTGYASLSLQPSSVQALKNYECNGVGYTGLIVGGVMAKQGEFPHMAAIGWRNSKRGIEFMCGGSLISERFVLTAAHCSHHGELGLPYLVRLGDQNLDNNNDGAVPVEVIIKRIIKHPRYDSETNKNDIALIELAKNVTFNLTSIRPGCLQQGEYGGANVTATGWGKTGTFKQTSDELMKVSLPVNRIGDCENKLEHDHLDSTRQICAGGINGKDTCEGDSGAPIQVTHKEIPCVYDIIGLTSFGSALCGKKAPAVYTKISYYLDWIEKTVWPQNIRNDPPSYYQTRRPTYRPTNTGPVWI